MPLTLFSLFFKTIITAHNGPSALLRRRRERRLVRGQHCHVRACALRTDRDTEGPEAPQSRAASPTEL